MLSLAGVDANAAAAAPGAAPLPAPSGACCSLRLDGEPALPPLVDAECAAPAETGGVPRAAPAPTGGGGRWAPPSPSGLSATPETMATRRPRRIRDAELGREGGSEPGRRAGETLKRQGGGGGGGKMEGEMEIVGRAGRHGTPKFF